MADFNDAKELEQWLQRVPAPIITALRTRVALRHLPHVLTMPDQDIWDFNSDSLVLACLRANLISGVLGSLRITGKEHEIKAVASDSARAAELSAARRAPKITIAAAGIAIDTVAKFARGGESFTRVKDLMPNVPLVHSNTQEHLNTALYTDIALLDSALDESGRVFESPLWTGEMPEEATSPWLQFLERAIGTSWEFWAEWYEGMLKGEPLGWEIQRRVALIGNSVWNAGPEGVAKKIAEIQSRWEVEKALSDIKGSLTIRTSARHGIGGNNPPESIEDERLSGAITLIWDATEELSTALDEENPQSEWIEAILTKFKSGLASFLKWCASKGDLAVDTLIKWGIPATGAWYAAKYPEKIEALIEAIERWLPFLS